MNPSKALLSIVLLGVFAFTGVGKARGQEIPSPYRYIETAQEAGVFGGIVSPDAGQFDLGPKEGPAAGVRYAIELSGPFSLEGVGRTLMSERDVRDPRRAEGNQVVGTADVLLTSVDARLKFSLNGRRTWHGLGPYVLAGAGLAFDLADTPAADTVLLAEDRFDFGTSFVGLMGVGVRWIPRDNFVIRTDAAFDLWQLDTPSGYLEAERGLFEDPPPENQWVSALALTLGAAFRW